MTISNITRRLTMGTHAKRKALARARADKSGNMHEDLERQIADLKGALAAAQSKKDLEKQDLEKQVADLKKEVSSLKVSKTRTSRSRKSKSVTEDRVAVDKTAADTES